MRLSERVLQRQGDLKLKEAFQDILALPFYVIGWLLGRAWWLLVYFVRAWVMGWQEGRG